MTSLGKLVFHDTYSRYPIPFSSISARNPSASLSLAFENLFYMPYDIIENYGPTIHTLDVSHNKFSRNLHFLAEFENLTSLNLDHNNIDSITVFPYMPQLQLLWLNNNNIEELFPFLKSLHKSLPNLRYLSLMGNKAAPSYLNGGTFYDYLQYRLFVISWFPKLVHLDDRVITHEQHSEAKRLFKRPFLEGFFEKAPIPSCMRYLHEKMSTFVNPISLPEKLKSRKSNLIV
ncbi:leucine-rich melanocyte differentiation-associated protein-like [Copidosoma floridanum]|uniref:leucine-rich melanocyte differentiation-associated protein-like n=1 Tax=Copidosoma floridanum TaxID=29053 RepID=UPI0006C98D5B|nr:leucine-rich melanocyte differentiation-associated protein-like [Copidosoma floridanum]